MVAVEAAIVVVAGAVAAAGAAAEVGEATTAEVAAVGAAFRVHQQQCWRRQLQLRRRPLWQLLLWWQW